MWQILSDLDTLELTRMQKGWTKAQENCFDKIKTQSETWIREYKGKPTADLWSFRAGLTFYTNSNKSVSLASAQEAVKLVKYDHAAAEYYKAVSYRYSQTKDITEALIRASTSTEKEPFDVVLQRRSMMLLRSRLKGQALFSTAAKWAKSYPNELEVQLIFFEAAIDIKNISSAQATLKQITKLDLSSSETSEPALRAEILNAQAKHQDAALVYKSLLSESGLTARKKLHYQKRYLESVAAMKSWREVRTTLDDLLMQDPGNARYRSLFDASIENGGLDPLNPIDDLEKALKVNAESFVIKFTLAKALINEFESGARQDKATLLARAEALTSQLSYADSSDIDIAYLNARVLYLKKVFSKAENEITPAIASSKAQGITFQTPLSDLYEIAARIAWARGDWGEAKRLAREGIGRISMRSEKIPLQKLLQQIP